MSQWHAQHRASVAELLAARSPQRRRELGEALGVTEESIKAAVSSACVYGVAVQVSRGLYAYDGVAACAETAMAPGTAHP